MQYILFYEILPMSVLTVFLEELVHKCDSNILYKNKSSLTLK